jgi:hypothetical protein
VKHRQDLVDFVDRSADHVLMAARGPWSTAN